jgi:squalene-hopene/tetraprenyl-beta-curcumene cyclase
MLKAQVRTAFFSAALALVVFETSAQLQSTQSGNVSLKNELERAIERGADWLVKNQRDKGYWSTTDHPAVTALALVALQGKSSPDSDEKAALRKGYDFLLANVHDDGTIHGGKGLLNYNTSIGLLALVAARDDRYKPQILAARKYLVGTQIDLGEKGKLDTRFDGGVGYGSKGDHSDMANTLQALEALYYSKQFTADSSDAKDLDWKAAIHFLQNCQNLPSHNPQASTDPADKGGFVYHPDESKAGTNTINGRIALRSYGSISYAGLLSYIYADLDKSDPRVQAVCEWLQKNYTLEENPAMGPQGLYYYFHTMAKALSAYGIDEFSTKSGTVKWREQLGLRLINLQKRDGSWENDNGRWFEKDPALVTSYAMLTLEMIAREI